MTAVMEGVDVEKEVPIEWVRVDGRFRKDLGDLKSLAKSIQRNGLIQAIAVTPDGRLLAGQRRLEAHRLLGRATIQARFVDNLEDAVARLRIERDENTERKEMTVSERVALAKALERLEAERIVQKQHEDRVRAGKIRQGTATTAQLSEESRGETAAEVAGRAVGMAPTTYYKAQTVVGAANDPTLPPSDQAVARAALEDMDATGNIAGNYEKVRNQRDARVGAPQKSVITTAKKQRRAISAATATLGGLVLGLKQIETIHPDITGEEAAQWVDDLSEARRVLEALIKRLKERTNA